MFKWFDAGPAEAQADQAVADIRGLVAKDDLVSDGGASRKKNIAKLDRTIEHHRRLAATAAYNVYQKAKFANRIKWALRDAGYPDDFIDSVVRLLII